MQWVLNKPNAPEYLIENRIETEEPSIHGIEKLCFNMSRDCFGMSHVFKTILKCQCAYNLFHIL